MYSYAPGTIGALLIVWLALFGIRKRAITTGVYSLKAWLSAHVYLGLSLLVIGTLHAGFHFGWNVHTLAYALMVLVIVSGMPGAAAYAVLPQALSANRGETTQRQWLETIRSLDLQPARGQFSFARPQPKLMTWCGCPPNRQTSAASLCVVD